jgi:hypothetical protein
MRRLQHLQEVLVLVLVLLEQQELLLEEVPVLMLGVMHVMGDCDKVAVRRAAGGVSGSGTTVGKEKTLLML